MIPKPFARGVFVVGPPLWVPRHLSPEAMDTYRTCLEEILSDVTDEADSVVQ